MMSKKGRDEIAALKTLRVASLAESARIGPTILHEKVSSP